MAGVSSTPLLSEMAENVKMSDLQSPVTQQGDSKKFDGPDEKSLKWIRDNIKRKVPDGLDGTDAVGAPKSPPDHGQIVFKGATRRAKGKFIRIKDDESAAVVYELLTKIWGMETPRLLISVTGGAKTFNLDPKLKQQFASGLLKVAQTPGAWVITGGTNTGVMKHVGEALQGVSKSCIGIATWGIVSNREMLISDETAIPVGAKFPYEVASSLVAKGAFLDFNHSHFLLVDNGTTGKYGAEIQFRSQLEKFINESSKSKVPSVLLVVEGGSGTLGTVAAAVTGDPPVPTVIIKDSGRAADCLAYALENITDEELEKLGETPHQDLWSWIEDEFKELNTEEKRRECYNRVVQCLNKRDQLTVYQMGSGASGVDEAILMSLLSGRKTSAAEQLRFTLLWDRPDLAEENILAQNLTWQHSDLADAMIMALALDRVDFVKLLLNYSVNIASILTKERLEFLYAYRSLMPQSTLRYLFDDDQYAAYSSKDPIVNVLCSYEGVPVSSCAIPRTVIEELIAELCESFQRQGNETFIEDLSLKTSMEQPGKQKFTNPFRELFFWAVLNNMQEMAMYLWEFEEECMAKSLIAAELNQGLLDKAELYDLPDDQMKSLQQNIIDFKALSLTLLNEVYSADDAKTEQLITSECDQFPQQTCLKLAIASNHLEFVSHSAVQTLLNDVWTGAIKQGDLTWTQILLGMVFPPYVCYKFNFRTEAELKKMIRTEDAPESSIFFRTVDATEDVESSVNEGLADESRTGELTPSSQLVSTGTANYESFSSDKRRSTKRKELPWYRKLFEFYFKTPVTKFYANLIAYVAFLILFAYVAILKKTPTIHVAEWVLIVFVVSLLLEEFNEIVQNKAPTWCLRLSDWASSKWNLLDAVATTLFFVALGLRLNKSTEDIGHLLYALDAGLFILRLLDVFFAHRILGPYVVMIYRMFIDMMYFMVILFVFLSAYGVSTKAILKPQNSGWKMLEDVFFHPYFNIYGELFIDRDPENNVTTRFGTPVLNSYAEPITWILLGGYLLIANVLLLNLLIAIFNNTFTAVQDNSTQIWRSQRYSLIIEYANRPALVPPLSILVYLFEFASWLINSCCRLCNGTPRRPEMQHLQSMLTEQEKEEVDEFEMDCIASFIRRKSPLDNVTPQEMTQKLQEQVEDLFTVVESIEDRLRLKTQLDSNAETKEQ